MYVFKAALDKYFTAFSLVIHFFNCCKYQWLNIERGNGYWSIRNALDPWKQMFAYFSLVISRVTCQCTYWVFIKRASYERTNKMRTFYDKNSAQFFKVLFLIESCRRQGSELRKNNILYWLCYYSCPHFSSFASLNLVPPFPTAILPFSSCPWVMHISLMASPLLILFLTYPWLFCTYKLCF